MKAWHPICGTVVNDCPFLTSCLVKGTLSCSSVSSVLKYQRVTIPDILGDRANAQRVANQRVARVAN